MIDAVRLIAGGLLALISSYVGLQIKRRYAEREKFYADMTEFCAVLKSDVGYTKKPLPAVISDFCEGRKGECAALLTAYVAELKTKGTFKRDVKEWDVAHLKLEEKKSLLNFLNGLGKTALAEQLALGAKGEAEFGAAREKCVEETKRLGGMYFKLLVLLGIALLIIVA